MKISMIAAMTPDRIIGGADGGIPWSGKLPRDQQHFRRYTQGKWMLLGRTTYEEMDGWFTTQVPIVVTSRADYSVDVGHVASDVETAIELARSHGADELVVSGGASIYEAALPFADTLVLTIVDADLEGVRHFPEWNEADWQVESEIRHEADKDNAYAVTFRTLVRASQPC